MATLMRASRELFRRSPDDRLPDFPALVQHCRRQMDEAAEIWLPPGQLQTSVLDSDRLWAHTPRPPIQRRSPITLQTTWHMARMQAAGLGKVQKP